MTPNGAETIKPINLLLEAALNPRAFEPKTWYASCFGVNDNGQTVLIGPYDEDELIQEAERRGAVNILRELQSHLLRESVRINKELLTEDWTDGWKISVGFNVANATIDTILSSLRAHEYEEREEIQPLPTKEEEEFPSALYKRIVARKQGLY